MTATQTNQGTQSPPKYYLWESYLPHDSDNLDLEAGWNKMSLFGEFVKPEINKLTIIRPGD